MGMTRKEKLGNETKKEYNEMSTKELIKTLNRICHNDYATKFTRAVADYVTAELLRRERKKKK